MKVSESLTKNQRRIRVRAFALLFGTLLAYLLSETILLLVDSPKVYHPHSSPDQFQIKSTLVEGQVFYRNYPSTNIRFVYDGNPRGYFGPDNEIDHSTNSDGFRGKEFIAAKKPNTKRLLFLGDSFTFGEGVRDGDTYPEQTVKILHQTQPSDEDLFESYNLGVGGYNTTQALIMLKEFGLQLNPDIIILGYVPNDAELPLFKYDEYTGEVSRRQKAIESLTPQSTDLYFGVRSWRMCSGYFEERRRSQKVIQYYRSIYEKSAPGYKASCAALFEIGELCKQHQIPCYVVHFPLLFQLDDYPLIETHEKIAAVIKDAELIYVDLLPELTGMDEHELWVHPTDQHPNEIVHRLAAETLVEKLAHSLQKAKSR